MFRGVSQLNLDAKGRIAIPSRYRAVLEDKAQGRVVVTVDRDGCLLLYPSPEWDQIEQMLMSRPNLHPQVRRLQRLLVGHATDCELDAQGRLLLPSPLREFAGLDKKVVLVGQGNKFEIWDEQNWSRNRDLWFEAETKQSDGEVLDMLTL